ncbi:MAG: S8 family serine peptidase [Proteobacteria bacterium]|nr:S8 family serine peptidase [Pseudomonadota bacterium]MDA1294358.1 S8 family serine peptidase [Pseudomonadota bacterium]
MKKLLVFIIFWFSAVNFAISQEKLTPTSISFDGNKNFIASLSEILKQEFNSADVQKALAPFNARSNGFRAATKEELFEKLPLASNDLIVSSRNLGLLDSPKTLVELQNHVYFSAVSIINPEVAEQYRPNPASAMLLLPIVVALDKLEEEARASVSISASNSSIAENGGTTTITVALSGAVAGDVDVTLGYGSTATQGNDFSASSTVSIPQGQTIATFTVTSIDDSVYEGDETGTITITAVSNSNVSISSSNSVTLTIIEDEAVPNVSLAASATTVSEEGGSGITFTASIDQVTSVDLTVTLAVTINSRSMSAYTPNVPSSIDIIIPAGSLSGTATYTPTNNDSYDGTSNVSFRISSVSGGGDVGNTVNIPSSGTSTDVAIVENETPPTVQLSASGSSVAENGSAITLTATLSGSTYADVTVALAGTGTARSGTDYSIANITIAAGTTTGTAAFTPIQDSLYEGADETATISISSVSGGGVTTGATTSQTITLSDSDSAPTVTLASSGSSITEGGSVLTLTATLSVATTSNVTVTIDTSGTATEGTDYSAISDITVPAGSTTGTASFSVTDDSIYEGSETAIISIGSVSGGGASAAGSGTSATITLSDNETAPTVNLSSSSSSVLENGSAITITATLSGTADEAVTVPLDTSGTATEGTDYAAISDITISAGATTGTATITPTDDSVSEGAETLIVSVGTLSGADATAGSTSSLTLSLVDDDVPNITLTSSASSIAENSGSSLTLTATASMTATEDIVVTLATAGTATSGTDYTALPATLTIAAGATTATTSFTPTDDNLYDADSNETAIVSITDVAGGNALESGNQAVTLIITDNESAPTVTLASSSSTVAEDGGTSTLTATLSNATYADVSVVLGATGSATSGTDYSYTSSITIAAGSTTGTSVLTATADDIFDAASDETAIISISSVSGGSATESGAQSKTITITDAESAPTVTLAVSSTTITEGASAETITANLSGKTYADVVIAINTSGTATEGTDYSVISDITISAGSTSGTASFAITDDSVYEGSETAVVSIGSVGGGSASAAGSGTSATITLADNETALTVNLSASASTVVENGSAVTITATLSGVADEAVTVPLDTSGTATEGTDYAAISDITIAAGATTGTATITPTDDNTSEGNETIVVSMGTLSGANATAGSTTSLSFSLTDDESTPSITLTASGSSIAENSSSTITLTVTTSVIAAENIVVSLSGSGAATSGSDYQIPSTITITAGSSSATGSFDPTDDSIYDGASSENAIISISGVSGGNAVESGEQSVTISITDNETAPSITLSVDNGSSSSVTEGGTNPILKVTASTASAGDIIVNLVAGGSSTASVNVDYTLPSSITILAGDTSNTASLSIVDDDIYESSTAETIIVDISSVTGGSESGNQSVTVSITDNESAPTVTLSRNNATVSEDGGTSTITATLSGATYEAVTVTLSDSGTAIKNTDFSYPASITISAGELYNTGTFTSIADDIYDAASDETSTISIASISGGSAFAGSSSQSVSFTIDDAESAPTVTLSRNNATVSEDGGTSTITATLSGATYEAVTITLSDSGTAIKNTDFSYTGSITISAGALEGTDTFTSIADEIYDAASDESTTISIASVSGGGASAGSGSRSASITIDDAESAPTVTLGVNAFSIAENSGSSISVTATLSNKSYQAITVGLSATGGDATVVSGTDFSVASSITIPAYETYASVPFTPSDDSITPVYEEDETVTLAISGVTSGSASLGSTTSQTITIIENEIVPSVTLSGTTSIDEKTEFATVTATLSIRADAAITLALSKSGTATNSIDYSISDIIVLAGETSSESILRPVNDTDYEGGSETVILTASASGISGISNSNSVTITITNEALNSGTQATYSSSLESYWSNSIQFSNTEYYDSNKASNPNPWETINLAKAFAYGKYGDGITVAISDGGFWLTEAGASSDHSAFANTTVIAFGSFNAPTGTDCNDLHGTCVAGTIAANRDSLTVGVAPDVRLHISDFRNSAGYSSSWKKLEAATASAAAYNAAVMNHSWGPAWSNRQSIDIYDVFVIKALYGYSTYLETFKGYWGSDIEDWMNELKDFQSKGVVVWANGNDFEQNHAHAYAAIPYFFPDWKGAWITVANVDVTGSSTKTYTRIGNKCGLAASFCLATDGHNIALPSHKVGSISYWSNATGTSFSAPTVSGAIALMAHHFPNQTPEQWANRLFASANNDIGFAHVNSTNFGNGVVHGYSLEAGHGILDVYAALQPITSNSYSPMVAAGSSNSESSRLYDFDDTFLVMAASFGSAITSALDGEVTYMYDALDGGFAFNLSDVVVPSIAVSKPSITASSELGRTILTERLHENLTPKNERDPATDGYFEFSMAQSNQTLNEFLSEGSWSGLNDTQYMFPFLSDVQGGTGLSFGNNVGDDYFSISFSQQHEKVGEGELKQALTFSYGTEVGDSTDVELIAGYVDEQEYFLGTKGSGAFDFTGANNTTSFLGFKSTSLLGDGLILNAGVALSYTDVNKPSSGIITAISDVTASAFEVGLTKFGIIGGDALSFSLGQPHRVEEGNANLQIAGLKNSDGSVPYTYKTATLAPSGRQIDLAMAYNFDLSETSVIRFKTMRTLEKGHVADANPENSLFLGFASEQIFGDDQFAIGAAFTDANDTTFNMNYSLRW